jgi:hypothetical protein
MIFPIIKGKKVKYSHKRLMGPRGFWEVKASRFSGTRHLKVVGCQPYAPAVFTPPPPGTNFKRLSRPRAHVIVGCHGKIPQ